MALNPAHNTSLDQALLSQSEKAHSSYKCSYTHHFPNPLSVFGLVAVSQLQACCWSQANLWPSPDGHYTPPRQSFKPTGCTHSSSHYKVLNNLCTLSHKYPQLVQTLNSWEQTNFQVAGPCTGQTTSSQEGWGPQLEEECSAGVVEALADVLPGVCHLIHS